MDEALNISRVVRHLMLRADEDESDIALVIGTSRKTAKRRLSGELAWTAPEVAALARHYHVPVALLYAGEDALLAGASTGGEPLHLKWPDPLLLAA